MPKYTVICVGICVYVWLWIRRSTTLTHAVMHTFAGIYLQFFHAEEEKMWLVMYLLMYFYLLISSTISIKFEPPILILNANVYSVNAVFKIKGFQREKYSVVLEFRWICVKEKSAWGREDFCTKYVQHTQSVRA